MPTRNQSKNKTEKKLFPSWAMYASIAFIVVLALLIYFISRFAQKAASTPTTTSTAVLPAEIPVEDAYLVFGLSSVTFVDGRASDDWTAYHIDKSLSIPSDVLSQHLSEIPKTDTIIIVDAFGGDTSVHPRTLLQNAGYPHVTIMASGIDAWVQKRFPLIGTGRF